jgi:hypothetical protein
MVPHLLPIVSSDVAVLAGLAALVALGVAFLLRPGGRSGRGSA